MPKANGNGPSRDEFALHFLRQLSPVDLVSFRNRARKAPCRRTPMIRRICVRPISGPACPDRRFPKYAFPRSDLCRARQYLISPIAVFDRLLDEFSLGVEFGREKRRIVFPVLEIALELRDLTAMTLPIVKRLIQIGLLLRRQDERRGRRLRRRGVLRADILLAAVPEPRRRAAAARG